VNASIASYRRHLDIRVHEATGQRMVRVYNSETNDVVREIPSEQVLDAHAHLLELAGLFMDTRG
jgi:flagellar protein FlaG